MYNWTVLWKKKYLHTTKELSIVTKGTTCYFYHIDFTHFLKQSIVVSIITSWTVFDDPGNVRTERVNILYVNIMSQGAPVNIKSWLKRKRKTFFYHHHHNRHQSINQSINQSIIYLAWSVRLAEASLQVRHDHHHHREENLGKLTLGCSK